VPVQILIDVVDLVVPYLVRDEMVLERGVLFVSSLEFLHRNCVDPSIELL
jgi:hypothetical protein